MAPVRDEQTTVRRSLRVNPPETRCKPPVPERRQRLSLRCSP